MSSTPDTPRPEPTLPERLREHANRLDAFWYAPPRSVTLAFLREAADALAASEQARAALEKVILDSWAQEDSDDGPFCAFCGCHARPTKRHHDDCIVLSLPAVPTGEEPPQ